MASAESEAHDIYRKHVNHGGHHEGPHPVPGIQSAAPTGVIYVSQRAAANGFVAGDKEWANFGQGAPEVGQIPGSTPKPTSLNLEGLGEQVHEYGPTAGILPLRQAVADYYNREFRQDKPLKYAPENICIVPGGRAGLARIASVLGNINLGFQIPVYTAYEQLLSVFSKFVPIPTQTDSEHGYKMTVDEMTKEIRNRGLSAFLLSNPCNPTGVQIKGEELRDLVKLGRESECLMLLDEVYSWYQLQGDLGKAVSAAEYVDDPDEDPIVLIDGMTKNFRAPAWRVCWVVGPKEFISALASAGSYLDGGASTLGQYLSIQMLEPSRVEQDRIALQKHFRMKRELVLSRLAEMGLEVHNPPDSTFYIWLDVKQLPAPLNSGFVFFEEALKAKVILTPGVFFDINPNKRRNLVLHPCESFVRLSFGPDVEQLKRGLDSLEKLIKKAKEDPSALGKDFTKLSDKHHHTHHGHASAAGS